MKRPVITLVLAAACLPATRIEAAAPAVDKLVACSDVKDADQRLACFDREIAPFARSRTASTATAPVSTPPAPAAAPPSSPPPPAAPPLGEEQLASSKRRAAEPAEEPVMHATITAQREVAPGRFTVSLDNGQVWRHEDDRLGPSLRAGDAVTISKAALGSYRLTRDAGQSKNWIRVTRIR